MTRSRWWVVLSACVATVVVGLGATWMLGRQRALTSIAFVDVSASTAARAMQDDHFYSDYGDKVLVVRGTVVKVQGVPGGREISLHTDTAFGLTCVITSSAPGPQLSVGKVVGFVAIGARAHRESSSVRLPDCRSVTGP